MNLSPNERIVAQSMREILLRLDGATDFAEKRKLDRLAKRIAALRNSARALFVHEFGDCGTPAERVEGA